MEKGTVKLGNKVIKMAGARERKKNANNPNILTLFKEEETGQLGRMGHFKKQKAIHVIPLGFSSGDDEKVQTAKRIIEKKRTSRVKVGTYTDKNGCEECCLVLETERSSTPPSFEKNCGVNDWTQQSVIGIWKNALDLYPAVEVWRELTRALGRRRHGYIVR